MFTAALITITKTWKQSKSPSTDERIKKKWSIHTMEHCSAMKKNGLMPSAAACMDLEIIKLSAVSQKDKYHTLKCRT